MALEFLLFVILVVVVAAKLIDPIASKLQRGLRYFCKWLKKKSISLLISCGVLRNPAKRFRNRNVIISDAGASKRVYKDWCKPLW